MENKKLPPGMWLTTVILPEDLASEEAVHKLLLAEGIHLPIECVAINQTVHGPRIMLSLDNACAAKLLNAAIGRKLFIGFPHKRPPSFKLADKPLTPQAA